MTLTSMPITLDTPDGWYGGSPSDSTMFETTVRGRRSVLDARMRLFKSGDTVEVVVEESREASYESVIEFTVDYDTDVMQKAVDDAADAWLVWARKQV